MHLKDGMAGAHTNNQHRIYSHAYEFKIQGFAQTGQDQTRSTTKLSNNLTRSTEVSKNSKTFIKKRQGYANHNLLLRFYFWQVIHTQQVPLSCAYNKRFYFSKAIHTWQVPLSCIYRFGKRNKVRFQTTMFAPQGWDHKHQKFVGWSHSQSLFLQRNFPYRTPGYEENNTSRGTSSRWSSRGVPVGVELASSISEIVHPCTVRVLQQD